MQAALPFLLPSTKDKKKNIRRAGCPLDTCKLEIPFIFFFPFFICFRIHLNRIQPNLLTACSSFALVPFVSMTERETEPKSFGWDECEDGGGGEGRVGLGEEWLVGGGWPLDKGQGVRK